jgi:hypothetical protein
MFDIHAVHKPSNESRGKPALMQSQFVAKQQSLTHFHIASQLAVTFF